MTFFYSRLSHNITLFAIALVVFGKLLLEPTTQLDFGLALFVIVLITSTWHLILRLAVISLAIGLLQWNGVDNAAYWQLGLWGGGAFVFGVINNLERQSVKVSETTLGEVTMALETAVECIARLDSQGQYLTVNYAYAHLLGYKPEDLIGKNWEITVHPQDVAKLTATYQQMLATGKAEGEARGIRQDGSHFYKQVTLVKINHKNSVSGHYCFVKDITQRKQQEERLRLLESVVVNANDAIVITEAEPIQSPGPRILYVNEAFTRMTGYSLQEVLGKTPRLLQGPKTDKETLTRIRTTLQQWHSDVFELVNYRKDGSEFWVELSIVPIADDTGWYTHWISVQRDITQRKEVEEVLAKLLLREQQVRMATEEASRMKDEFLAVVSHELRTPLNAMLGWSRLLRSRSLNEQTTIRALETIERNAQAQTQLIEDLLDISRMMRGKLRLQCRPIHLTNLIEAAIDTIQLAAAAKDIQIHSVLTTTKSVFGDPDRLQQIIWNLLSNAIKFTPHGGRVEISLIEQNTYIELNVIDNGQGISADFLPHIFEQFRQADSSSSRKQGGIGLGLAIARNLVELHGGTISATSQGSGTGATFMVRLPLPRESDLPETKNDPEFSPESGITGLKVLVVDDEADARELLKIMLEQAGANVTAVSSVSEAINLIEQLQPDILLSDIGMPEEDGYSLIQKTKHLKTRSGKQIPAAAITAYARAEDQAKALQAGFQTHLTKPIDPVQLMTVVKTLAERTSY
ncbi:PAS domain S-box protein [Gloeocapsopsis sp. IPPAS B-1203]|uniref:hybrid sensor histidine kinase/response regulator n=1 Tax=Gloeocapsopsis sp. IPPAS B-1203 TaxID=2049454 RepID=UPI000C19B183|nr:PAS domain S-box protein [Gloeocapsopsis sp. IPPAS B-1203]PIG93978.1 hybrid sensor histidine kinase/response regulator [Gloeocapsopsis sp. IPPAS B-1203]